MIRIFDDDLLNFFIAVWDGEIRILLKFLIQQSKHALFFAEVGVVASTRTQLVIIASSACELLVLKHQTFFFISCLDHIK